MPSKTPLPLPRLTPEGIAAAEKCPKAAVSIILDFNQQCWDYLYTSELQRSTRLRIISRYGLMTTWQRKAKYEELGNSLRALWNSYRQIQQTMMDEWVPRLLKRHGPAAVENAKAQIAAVDYEAEMKRPEEIVAAVRLKVMISAPSSIPCAHMD